MEKDAIRVVIADDEPISRMDLKELLTEGGYTVVAEVSDGFDAVENCKLSQLKGLSMRRVAEMILVKGGG